MTTVATSPTDTPSINREALVHAARHLALQRDDVVRLTEVLNNRPWAECGPEEVRLWSSVSVTSSVKASLARLTDEFCTPLQFGGPGPRTNTALLSAAEHLFAALTVQSARGDQKSIAVEIAADAGSRRFLARCSSPSDARRLMGLVGSAYPQAELRPLRFGFISDGRSRQHRTR